MDVQQNVSGVTWVECFIDALNADMKEKVKKISSANKFKFGGGRIQYLQSLHQLQMSIMTTGEITSLTFDVHSW